MALVLASLLPAQEKKPTGAAAHVLRATTRLVLVDTIVLDKQGNHVTDLTRDDFTLLEHGKRQKIDVFSDENEAPLATEKDLSPAPFPPHVYTNRIEYRRTAGPPTFLLLDGLNTAVRDQTYVRGRMLRYIQKQLQQGQRCAVLSLNDSLVLLQDFTDDPKLLLGAIEKYTARESHEMSRGEPRRVTRLEAEAMSGTNMLQLIDRMNQSQAVDSIEARAGITLAALRSIARAAAGLRGRKNLVWVSSAFPFTLAPGQGANSELYRNFTDDVRRTAALLASAQVAVYPVDARGEAGDLAVGALPTGVVRTTPSADDISTRPDEELTGNNEVLLGSHEVMQNLAEETGGIAFYNNNEVDRAVALSIADGSRYYTLGYYPEDGNWDGKFRRIEVRVKREGVKLRYRRGYYAVDPAQTSPKEKPKERDQKDFNELQAALADPMPATAVTFRVQVLPPGADEIAHVQFLVDSRTVSFEEAGPGLQHCSLDFLAAAVSPEGKVTASDGKTVDARLNEEQYNRAQQQGLPFAMQLQLAPGSYTLRLAVRDNRTKSVGTLTVPLRVEKP
jgi:VWFA-related protein